MARKKPRFITFRTSAKLYAELRRRAKAEKRTLSAYTELLIIAATVATQTGLPPASELRDGKGVSQ